MQTFVDLVTSRQKWIAEVLRPWCASADWKELQLAEQEWLNLAGKVEPEGTLWAWAWNRFPGLVNTQSWKIDETHPISIKLVNGQTFDGYPDGRRSLQGKLVLLCRDRAQPQKFVDAGPFRIDEIVSVATLETV